jgi:hypothetical protein
MTERITYALVLKNIYINYFWTMVWLKKIYTAYQISI